MEQLGWVLIHFLWQGALVASACAFGFALTRSPQARYWLGAAGMAAMAISPLLTWIVLNQSPAERFRFEAPAVLPLAAPPLVALDSEWEVSWIRLLPILWAAGVAVCAARVGLGWWMERRVLARSMPVSGEWVKVLGLVASAAGVRNRWRALISDRISVPQVSGVFRPVLLLPASLLLRLPAEQVEAVLAHEFAHIRRHDYLVNLLQTAVECLLFYHPAVWWLSRRVREERELCCDAAASEYCGDRAAYARALLSLEEMRTGLSMAASGGSLSRRVAIVLGARPPVSFTGPVVALLLLAGAIGWAAQKATPLPPAPPRPPQPPLAQKLATPYMKWLYEDAAYIITEQERIVFLSIQSEAEREKFIEQFWQRRDPTPGTPANEFKEEHYRRISYANKRFAGELPGWRTDRGRVYISLGPPDEIESRPDRQTEEWRWGKTRTLSFGGPGMRLTSPAPAATPRPAPAPPPPPPAPKPD